MLDRHEWGNGNIIQHSSRVKIAFESIDRPVISMYHFLLQYLWKIPYLPRETFTPFILVLKFEQVN